MSKTTIDIANVKPIYFKFATEQDANEFALECAMRPHWEAEHISVLEVPGKGWAVSTLGDSRFYYMGVK